MNSSELEEEPSAQPRGFVREGFVAGLIGALVVAAWFLLVDVIAGRPFFTPAVLGSAVFFELRDPAEVTISVQAILAYTSIHIVAFVGVGVAAAAILRDAEKDRGVLWLALEFFIAIEFGFYAVVAIVFMPLLAELAWFNVAAGNLIAAGAMGYYFVRVHPMLRKGLLQ
ncbi:MAG: hypothetical protein JRG93_17670 [Deltaproteobacteria bacterium]|nr:hypothetical protein [Deltaproteobacteria bacterium]